MVPWCPNLLRTKYGNLCPYVISLKGTKFSFNRVWLPPCLFLLILWVSKKRCPRTAAPSATTGIMIFLMSILARCFFGGQNPFAYASGCCSCSPIFHFQFSIFNYLPPPQPERGCHIHPYFLREHGTTSSRRFRCRAVRGLFELFGRLGRTGPGGWL